MSRYQRKEPPSIGRVRLRRLERVWRIGVREMIKRLPAPPSFYDVIRLFEAAEDEVRIGRKIVTGCVYTKSQKRAKGGA